MRNLTAMIIGLVILILLGLLKLHSDVDTTTISNSASKYCIRLGGNLSIVNNNGQVGLCVFKNKAICEEWSLFYDRCKVKDFCGISTFGKCKTDSDCITTGCSNEVCQSKDEDLIITTCNYDSCKNSTSFNLSCGCVNGQCVWASKNLLT